jgi:hypothetical protein
MTLVPLRAMLWRRVNRATFDTLHGNSPGQYHITLTASPAVASFVAALPKYELTELGGYTVDLPIEPFDGTDPVLAETLRIRYMGGQSQRKDWNIPAQRPETAYTLWRPGRGVPAKKTFAQKRRDFILVLLDANHHYHARFIRDESFAKLPHEVQDLLNESQFGVKTWET